MMGWGQGFTGGMGGWGLMGGSIGLLFLLGIVVAFAALVIWAWRRAPLVAAPLRSERPSAFEALQRRYARGELTRDEFLAIKQDLS